MSERARAERTAGLFALLLALLAGCTQYEPFDSEGHLRGLYHQQMDPAEAEQVLVPFALTPQVEAVLDESMRPSPREQYRVEQVIDFIFHRLNLQYSLVPTRSAVEAFHAREGNCLSFVNLFVGVARHMRLTPFYVEVTDHQRWRHQDGMVLSQGHIVAGMYVAGELRTYDFLPYRPKSYKDFNPIDDLKAAAHYYNNLAAEALIEGDGERALSSLDVAISLAPSFDKALNNLGVVRARRGDVDGAFDAYRRGLESDPGSVPILSNLARLYQQEGKIDEAIEVLERIEGSRTTNPFYFVYRGELALTQGELSEALDFMRHALRLDTEIPEVHVGLAKVYLGLGEINRARHHVERALKLDATHREARNLAMMIAERSPD